MTTTWVFVLVLGLNAVQRNFHLRLAEDAPWARVAVYLVVLAWIVYRLVLYSHIRRLSRNGIPPKRRSTDHDEEGAR